MSDQDLAAHQAGRRQRARQLRHGPSARARAVLALLTGIAAATLDARGYHVGERLDERAFDAQVGLIRALQPDRPAPPGTADVVLVGVDEASLEALAVPLSLMHATLGTALVAIAATRPSAIGLDIALPERSFDHLLPGLDVDLMQGLRAARSAGPFTVALDADAQGRLRIPYAPLLAAAGGAADFGLPLFPLDCDGVVRRYEPDLGSMDTADCAGGTSASGAAPAPVPTFAGRLAQQLGRPAALAQAGWIDFTRGPALAYVPLQDVVHWQQTGQRARLRAQFGGRVVLVGSVLPYLDRLRLPVSLTAWENAVVPPPGLIANAQVLRNALGGGLVQRPARFLSWLAVIGFAAAALPARAALRYALLAAAVLLGVAAATALHAAGWFLAPGAAIIAGAVAVGTRTALDLAAARGERERLARRFGGYLSPPLLRALIDESMDEASARQGVRRSIALLFADLRDFTRRSEHSDPEHLLAVLNRYYTAITPVLHAHGGLIDNFRGDGIMVMFGAPMKLARPCDAALAAAGQMLAQIERLNRDELAPRRIAGVGVTMGLAYGEVVYGELGSPDRRDFTALGDAVNVAAHLQTVAKQVGQSVVMTAVFAENLTGRPDGMRALGMQEIKGHTPLALFAWSPPAPRTQAG